MLANRYASTVWAQLTRELQRTVSGNGQWLFSEGFGPDDARHAPVVDEWLVATEQLIVGSRTVSRETVHGPKGGFLVAWGSETALHGIG